MKLWMLQRTDYVNWDEFAGFVIRAENEAAARRLAFARANGDSGGACANEDPNVWYAQTTACIELTADGGPGIILHDYRAS